MSTTRRPALTLPCSGLLSCAVALACAPPWSPLVGCDEDEDCATESSGDGGTTAAATTSGGGGEIQTVTGSGGAATSTGGEATGEASSTGEAEVAPKIYVIDVPLTITAAGPVEVRVFAEHAWSVRGVLDGQETIYFDAEGDGDGDGVDSFVSGLSIFGSVDNGPHALEVIAERGELEDRLTRPFEVAAPAAGTLAWEQYGGPGSQAPRLVLTQAGDLFEGGAFGLGEVQRPSLRKRDALTGAELFPGGSVQLDAREGAVADLALAPDGRLWVAMNVREGNTWRARIGLYEPNGQPTGIAVEKPGATVAAIDGDGDGGCFAVGYGTTIHGDADVLIWRMSAEGVPIFSGQPWDHQPEGFDTPHAFSDLAFDVVVDGLNGEAWIVGASQGEHDLMMLEARGMILRVDIDTLAHLGPVIVAPPAGSMTQSVFYGADLDPGGILVTGNQCNSTCATQRLTAARYDPAGLALWTHAGDDETVAFGASVARTSDGRVLVAGNVKDGATMRGMLLGRGELDETFDPIVFPGKGASAASSVIVGPYDWAFCSGQATVGGAPQAYVLHPHL